MMALRRAESFSSIHVPLEDAADAEASRPRFSTIVTDASDESSVLLDPGSGSGALYSLAPAAPASGAAGRGAGLPPYPALGPAMLSPATLSPPSRPHPRSSSPPRSSIDEDADLDGEVELEVAAATAKRKSASPGSALNEGAPAPASAGSSAPRNSLGFPAASATASAHLRAQHSSSPAFSRFLSDFHVGDRVAVSTAVPVPSNVAVRRYFSGSEHFEI
jgi:hypothetical protein